MFGSHLSIAGGMVNALREARRLKMDCVQVFTKNQRQWAGKAIGEDERAEWLDELDRMGWDSIRNGGAARVVSHNSYLINMASPDAGMWKRSVAAQRDEIERCEALHIPYCVAHPGAHLRGARARDSINDLRGGPTKDEMAGLKRIVKALDAIHKDLRGYRTITCLETTVGSGTNLGYSFGQLAYIRSRVKQPERIGYCFDTCHVTAAGYDMTAEVNAAATLDEWDAMCGTGNLKVFHFNDSEGAVGSRVDRHAHIGAGCCGRGCFRTIVNRAAFACVPKVLETPKGTDEKGREWDLVNIRRLKRMTRGSDHADNGVSKRTRVAAVRN